MSSSKLKKFVGLIAPTFTPFNEKSEINLDVIGPYAELLKSKGISAVLINGTTGEGTSLSVQERKKITEKWSEICQNLDMVLMVQISGCSFADVIDLAEHAASLKVDGVLCLPELYFKPRSISKLVQYLKDISVYCPTIPIYYYHMPSLTQVDLSMESFMDLARKEIPTFAGIKFSSSELDQAVGCLKHGQVYLGSVKILCGAVALGFKRAIMTLVNIKPEMCLQIVELMEIGKVQEARQLQHQLNDFVDETMKKGNGNWVTTMKAAFNEEFKEINLGTTRKPL